MPKKILKKTSTRTDAPHRIDLAASLSRVKHELTNLKETTMTTAATKKTLKRKTSNTPSKAADAAPKDGVSLNDLAKELKVKPGALRRKIRTMEGLGEQTTHRYHWTKSSPDLKKIRAAYAD